MQWNHPGLRQLTRSLKNLHPAQFWLAVVLASTLPIAIGTAAFVYLMQIVEFPDCRTAAWTAESSSARLHCAEQIALRQTPEALKNAIDLANTIPGDDPYRPTSDRFIDQWSRDLLRLAETVYQEGAVEKAEEIISTIPIRSDVQEQAKTQLANWKALWRQAESTYAEAQEKIFDQRWSEAMAIARRLLYLGHPYWETTKYQGLMEELRLAQEAEESKKKATAQREARKPPPDIFARWKQQQQQEMADYLRKAYALAQAGSPDNLREAIAQAQMVLSDAPEYAEAQQAIARWRNQIEVAEDRPYLTRAMALASRGDPASLQAAIDEASLIPPGRALYGEARSRIEQWLIQVNQFQVPAEKLPQTSFPNSPEFLPPPDSKPASPAPAPIPIDPTGPI